MSFILDLDGLILPNHYKGFFYARIILQKIQFLKITLNYFNATLVMLNKFKIQLLVLNLKECSCFHHHVVTFSTVLIFLITPPEL